MIDPSLRALIDEAMEGALDEARQQELRGKLAGQPEALALFDDLLRVKTLLAEVPQVDPPAHLRASVMRALESGRVPRAHAQPAAWRVGLRRLFAAPAPGFRWGYAVVFLCGLLVGLLPLLGRPGLRGLGPDPDDLTGTLTSRRAGDRAAAVSRQVVAFGPVRGRVLVSRTSRGVIADLEMAATGEVDLVIEYDPRAYRLVGFEHTGEGAGEAEAGSGRVRVARFTTGWLRIALVDGAPPALPPLRLMASRGEESFEQAIEVHGDDR